MVYFIYLTYINISLISPNSETNRNEWYRTSGLILYFAARDLPEACFRIGHLSFPLNRFNIKRLALSTGAVSNEAR